MIEIPDFIEQAIKGGISVTVQRHCWYGVHFNMNLQAKSHMHIVKDGNQWFAFMRYNEKHEVESIDDLKRLARHGMHGREYISSEWAEFLMSDKERAEIDLGHDVLNKLTAEEIAALKKVI